MGKLRDRMVQDLKLAGYSPVTARVYLQWITAFTRHFMRSPTEMGEEEIRSYLLHLLDERKLSHSSYRQAYASLKFLYTTTLKRPFEVHWIPRRRRRPRPCRRPAPPLYAALPDTTPRRDSGDSTGTAACRPR